MSVAATVIVRNKDEAVTLERTLESLRAQTVPVEVVVVDSGSTDGSVAIARQAADTVVEIPASAFTYGSSLNVGARHASAPVHFALSAHCIAPRDWVERSLEHYEDPRVGGVCGAQTLPDGTPLTGRFAQTEDHARRHPFWGFSNHGSSWRAATWKTLPFDEALEYAEDKEWALRVLQAGWTVVFDPRVYVDMAHSWRGGARDLFRRQRAGTRALGSFQTLPDLGLGTLAREWWHEHPDDGHGAAFHRLNPRRMAGLAGKYVGAREARRRR